MGLQIHALPNMELVFDHSPIAEGLATLSGDPETEPPLEGDPGSDAAEQENDTETFSARPVVVEMRMECFAHAQEQVSSRDDRSANFNKQLFVCLLEDISAYISFHSAALVVPSTCSLQKSFGPPDIESISLGISLYVYRTRWRPEVLSSAQMSMWAETRLRPLWRPRTGT